MGKSFEPFIKEDIQMANRHVKRHQCCGYLVKGKLKLQRDETSYPVEWFKLKRWAISSIGKDLKELELSYIAGGNVKCSTGLENSLAVSKELYINL